MKEWMGRRVDEWGQSEPEIGLRLTFNPSEARSSKVELHVLMIVSIRYWDPSAGSSAFVHEQLRCNYLL